MKTGETTAKERRGEVSVDDPQDRDEQRELFDEIARRMEANARRTRLCRPWLGVVRSRQDLPEPPAGREAGSAELGDPLDAASGDALPWEVSRGGRVPHQRPVSRRPAERPDAAVAEHALVRAVMAEVLDRLPAVDLPEHVRERSAVVARAAYEEASEERPRASKLLRLRDRLADLLRAGLAERPSDAAQQLLGVVRQLY